MSPYVNRMADYSHWTTREVSPKKYICDLCHSWRVCQSLSHVQLFGTPWRVAHQASLSVRFSRQECWSGLPCPPPGHLPNPGIKPTSLMSPALAGGFLTTSTPWEAQNRACVTSNDWKVQVGTAGSRAQRKPSGLLHPISQLYLLLLFSILKYFFSPRRQGDPWKFQRKK